MAMPLEEAPQASQPLQMEQVPREPDPEAVSAPTPDVEAPSGEPMDIDDPEENDDPDDSDDLDETNDLDDFDESYDVGEPSRIGTTLDIGEPFNIRELFEIGEYERWRFCLTEASNCMLQQLPQYLFRVTSDKSQGTNITGFYQAGAITNNLGHANFFAYSKPGARQTTRDHLRSKKELSHWISFTASIIWAIQLALRMRETGEKNIRIHIIDTTRLINRPLIVHSWGMLGAYQIGLSSSLSYDVARTKTAWNEFLVWDELQVAADSIAFDDLLCPKSSDRKYSAPGLLDLMPNLGKTPKKGTWSRVPRRRFSKYYGLWEKLQLYKLAAESRHLHRPNYAGRFGHVRRSNLPTPEDARVPLDEWHLLDYMTLVSPMKKEFQFPMVVALLSMRTDFINQESMVEGLIKLPERYPKDDSRFKNLCFWRTTLRPGAKVDVQVFEKIYARVCAAIAGEEAVLSGPRHDHRKILRLDADPKVADTTEGIGSGPPTMALAVKANWTGLRMSRPSKLKAVLLHHRLIMEGIDQDFELTEAQLSSNEPTSIRLRDLPALQHLINVTCSNLKPLERQERMEKFGWYKDKRTLRPGRVGKPGRRQRSKYPGSWEAYLD